MSKKINVLVPLELVNKEKAVASEGPGAQPDLMFMRSLLVSTGGNLNDDVFVPDEMWKARSTPAYKPVDWEHNTGRELSPEEQKENPKKVVVDNQTIGVMYNAYVVDENHEKIDEAKASAADFDIPQNFHIIDEAVIWRKLYPVTAARIEKGAREGTLFVSMEAWFSDYDYLVGNKVVARNEETAFLDNSLRANGGHGTFGNSRVKRILRNITFGGKGIVARPANEPSIITSVSHEPMSAVASQNEIIRANIKSDIMNTKAAEPRRNPDMSKEAENKQEGPVVPLAQFTKAHEESTLLRAEAKTRDEQLAKASAQVTSLESQLESQKETLAKAFAASAGALEASLPGFSSRVTEGDGSNFFSVLAELLSENTSAKAELEESLKVALAKISKAEADARSLQREVRIDSVLEKTEADEDKRKASKEKLTAAVENLSDEDFTALLDTIAEMTKKDEKEDKKDKKGGFVPFQKKDKKEDAGKDKAGKKVMAEENVANLAVILGVSESDVAASLASLNDKGISAGSLEEVLDSVTASETAPAAGEQVDGAPQLDKAFAGLVGSMLNSNKPQDN
jgi:hypothetical protein